MARPISNYKGIIDAIKLKSGVKKSYPSNFWGIIQALLDLGLGGGSIEIIYPPEKPPTDGNDGDMIGYPNADGDWFIYIWADGSWQPIHVLTTDVLPNPPSGMPGRAGGGGPIYTPEGEELTNQQDINWYLYNHLNGGEQMVFYGETPPKNAARGSLFTQEDTTKQYVHQEDGSWVDLSSCGGGSGEGSSTANISLYRVSQGNKSVWLGQKQDPPEADPDGRVGWYYRNPGVNNRKAHWTLWSQETNAHKHITLGDLVSLSLLIQGQSELPFIQVYTKPKRDGNDAATTYRSRKTWQPPANPGGLQSVVFLTTNLETELYSNVNRLEYEHEEWNDKGPLEDDEQINKIIVSTNSTSPEGTYEFLLQAMIVESIIGTFEMQVEYVPENDEPQMVFYGDLPPTSPEKGAIFTQEDTLTQYVYDDGQWVQTSFCPSSGDGGTTEKPWVRIEEVTIDREWWATTNSANEYAAKVKIADIHYNDTYPSDLTNEWEFDEKGDGNWQPWDLKADLNVDDHYLAQFKWFIFLWAPEHRGSESGMDPAHAFPCSKGRVRITNTWKDGTFEKSEWYEFWLGKAASPSAGYEHKAPSVCINP